MLWVVVIYAVYSSHEDKKNVQVLQVLQEWRYAYEIERRLGHTESDFSARSAIPPVVTNNPVLLQVVLPPVVAPSPPPPYEGPPDYNSLRAGNHSEGADSQNMRIQQISTPPPEYPGPGALV